MQLSPKLYHRLIRPQLLTNFYIKDMIKTNLCLDNKTVLDFGCGTGANCLLYDPDNYLGIDINQNRINYAQKLYPNYQFQTLEPDEPLPFSANTFDQILLVAVLHHLATEKLNHLLPKFQQILKSEGEVVAIEPVLSPKNPLSNYFMQIFDNGNHIRKQEKYFSIFKEHDYNPQLIDKYNKLFFYQELFFTATH